MDLEDEFAGEDDFGYEDADEEEGHSRGGIDNYLEEVRETDAAISLQKLARRRLARKKVAQRKADLLKEQHEGAAAMTMQKHMRGRLARAKTAEAKARDEAAPQPAAETSADAAPAVEA
eukprot:6211397-Pleurochrysis_carterae.AAC.1